ncbi:MAG TPA: PilN domain-containing protein [Thiohalobacter sp.]|nr:PilN domain-containing protein [Thiohalobacter sp.]
MYQQINLYQPVFRHEKKVFSALTLLQLLGITVLVLLGIYAGLRWQLARVEHSLAVLETQHVRLNQQIDALEQARAGGELETLDNRIAQLEQRHGLLDQVLEELDGFQAPERRFSALLTGLAGVQTTGLWLTRIELLADGGATLEGRAWDAQRVPAYLEQLVASDHLGELGLSQVRIDNGPETGGVRFSLSNRHADSARLSRRAGRREPAS